MRTDAAPSITSPPRMRWGKTVTDPTTRKLDDCLPMTSASIAPLLLAIRICDKTCIRHLGEQCFSGEIRSRFDSEDILSHNHSYKGHAFDDDTAPTDDGRYRARVVLVTAGNGRPRSQRFIDLETFVKEDDARQRALAAARAWIDEEEANDKLALPTGFGPFLSA